jgi:hypothetical protein
MEPKEMQEVIYQLHDERSNLLDQIHNRQNVLLPELGHYAEPEDDEMVKKLWEQMESTNDQIQIATSSLLILEAFLKEKEAEHADIVATRAPYWKESPQHSTEQSRIQEANPTKAMLSRINSPESIERRNGTVLTAHGWRKLEELAPSDAARFQKQG